GLHRDRRQGARREHAPGLEPAREDTLRGEHLVVRGSVPVPHRARRRAHRARRAPPRALAPEVSVNFAAPAFLFGALLSLLVALLLLLGALRGRRSIARFGDVDR